MLQLHDSQEMNDLTWPRCFSCLYLKGNLGAIMVYEDWNFYGGDVLYVG